MDYESDGYEDNPGPGIRRLTRVIARMDGHTHIYQFAREDAWRARQIVKAHVEEGQLHPYAGLTLLKMIREVDDAI